MDSAIRKLLWITCLCLLSEKVWSAPSPDSADYINDDDYANDEDEDSNGEEPYTGPPPEILTKGGTVTVLANHNVHLDCEVRNTDNVAVMWVKDGTTISLDQLMANDGGKRYSRLNNNTLSIQRAIPSDEGTYECKIMSSPPVDINYHLIVAAAPRIVKKIPQERERTIRKGEALTLACVTEGNPPANVTWTRKDNKPFINGHPAMQGSSLTFENVDRRHSGTYHCSAENGFGSDSATFLIHVDYAPEIEVAEETVTTGESMEPEITCTVHAHPAANVSWFKSGQKLKNTSRLTMSNMGKQYTLRIRDMMKDDFGSYACHAENRIGSKMKTIYLTGTPSRPQVKAATKENEVPELKWSVQSHIPVKQYQLHYTNIDQEEKTVAASVTSNEGNIFSGMAVLSDIVPGDSEVAIRAYNANGWSSFTNITVTKGVGNFAPSFRPCFSILIVSLTSIVKLIF